MSLIQFNRRGANALSKFGQSLAGLLLLFSAQLASAQKTESVARVTGLVTYGATSRPAPQAQVRIEGTSLSATTGDDGKFSITNIPAGVYSIAAILDGEGSAVITNVQLRRGQDTAITLKLLRANSRFANTVSAAGVVTQEARKVPFGVDVVTAQMLPVVSPLSAVAMLEGKVAGLTVVRPSGEPGANVDAILRTPTTLDGATYPLLIVDGVMLSADYPLNAQDIDALDVAKIEVLKGVSATAQYGLRGLNGAILITTNRGGQLPMGGTQFRVRNEIGSEFNEDLLLAPTAHSYRVNAAGQYVNAAGAVVTRNKRVLQANGIVENKYVDPTYNHNDQVFKTGLLNTQTLVMQQNRASTNFGASYSRSQQSGVIPNADGFLRQTGRLNIDQRFMNRLQLHLAASHVVSGEEPSLASPLDVERLSADVNLRTAGAGGLSPYKLYPDDTERNLVNPLAAQLVTQARKRRARTLLNLGGEYRVMPWLSLNAQGSYDRGFSSNSYILSNPEEEFIGNVRTIRSINYASDSVAFGQFHIGALVTQSFGALSTNLSVSAETQREASQQVDSTESVFEVDQSGPLGSLFIQKTFRDRRVAAGIANLGVEYAGRYIGDFAFRREGLSVYGGDKIWTSYMRASGAWLLNEESWLPLQRFDLVKLHYSVGDIQTPTTQLGFVFAPNATSFTLPIPRKITEQEVGIDVNFKSRVQASITYATVHSVEASLNPTTTPGGNQFLVEYGLKGHTTEGTVQLRLLNNPRGLQWDVSVIGDARSSSVSSISHGCQYRVVNILCPGDKLNILFGQLLVKDKAKLQPRYANSLAAFDINDEGYVVPVGNGNTWRDGKAKNLWGTNVNVNGVNLPWGIPIVQTDIEGGSLFVPIADANPTLRYGLQNTLRYKGFRVYGQFTGQVGGEIQNENKRVLYYLGKHPDVDQSSRPDELRKPFTYYSRIGGIGNTEAFIEDASFLRLTELSVGYSLNADRLGFVRHIGAKRIDIDLVGRNLFTATKYTGINPTGPSANSLMDPVVYPFSRTFTIATSIVF